MAKVSLSAPASSGRRRRHGRLAEAIDCGGDAEIVRAGGGGETVPLMTMLEIFETMEGEIGHARAAQGHAAGGAGVRRRDAGQDVRGGTG